MQRFVVIGNPIAHSKSPEIHLNFAKQSGRDIQYSRVLCPNDEAVFGQTVRDFFAQGGAGANVTLPFKEMAYRLCANNGQLSDDAKRAGAVNTLAQKDGRLFGDNTDGKGLVLDLQGFLAAQGLGNLQGKTALILGAGGATRGVLGPLLQAGVLRVYIANRTRARALRLVEDFAQAGAVLALPWEDLQGVEVDVAINATSAAAQNQELHLPTGLRAKAAYDTMYGKPSRFLRFFADQGAKTCDGFGMLVAQAAFAFSLWTGAPVGDLDLRLAKTAALSADA